MPTKVNTRGVRLADGEAFVQGRSGARAAELIELAGDDHKVRATSHGYIVPEAILANYGGEYITAADQPAVITEPNTTTDPDEATNVKANRGDRRRVEGVESAVTPAGEQENAGGTEFDPTAATVDEVNEYLEGADEAERDRVLAAEAAGKARKGIIGEEN